MASYRPNVAIILRKPKNGKILVGERSDHKGCWQFPQGGVDKGEDLWTALKRETLEEIGVRSKLYTLREIRTGYRYQFPGGHLKKGLYLGQEQTVFLCDFHGNDADVNLTLHSPMEFRRWKWIKPEKFKLGRVPRFKREVFRRIFKDFFGVKLIARNLQPELESITVEPFEPFELESADPPAIEIESTELE